MSPTKNRQILVIDDNQTIHEDFRKILASGTTTRAELDQLDALLFGESAARVSQVDFQIDSALQGQEGLALVEESLKKNRRYAVAFVDVRMPPGWDGIETVSRIWQVDPDIQVVICTAFSEYSWHEMIAKLGNSDKLLILKKPFDNIEVQQLANALTEKWHLLQQTKNQLAVLEDKVKERTGELQALNGTLQQEIALHKRTAEALRQSQETVLRQERLTVVGQLSAGIAHEFNNILTVIQGHTSLLLTTGKPDEPTLESLQQIATSAERAASLTRQMLAFSRKQVIRRQSFDINKTISRMGNMLRRVLCENISLNCDIVADLPCVFADPGMVDQIIMNLVLNARDAMPRGGDLTIDAVRVEVTDADMVEEPGVLGSLDRHAGSFIRLRISDTGSGMDQVTMKHLFEPFFTTKDVGKGTGLGLATVYGIVQQHGGWIEVRSAVGKGTNFSVFLPIASSSEHGGPSKKPSLTAIDCDKNSGTILVVEDELSVRNLVSSILRRAGYKVFEAVSGPEALKICDQHSSHIDLLFTDMMMPDGMSGKDLADRVKQLNPAIRVIFSSGYTEELLHHNVGSGHKPRYLQKPYEPARLLEMVQRAMAENVEDVPC